MRQHPLKSFYLAWSFVCLGILLDHLKQEAMRPSLAFLEGDG